MDERVAAERIAARFGEIGYVADVEEFAARVSANAWLVAYVGLSAAAALVLYTLPLVAAVAGMVAVVLHARDTDGRPVWSRTSCTGSNVVARRASAEPPLLIVVAPVFSRVSRFRERTARALVVCLQTLMVAIPTAGAAAWVAEVDAELPRAVAVAGTAAAAAVLGVGLILYRPPSPDERGTSAPVDVLVALAPRLRDRPVWFVVTGAPEAGTDGIGAFVEAHASEVAGAAWLNLEASDGVVAVSEEGTWRERRADRWLMGAAEEAGAEVRPYRAALTNATPLLARRRRALTLMVPGDERGTRTAAAVAAAALERGASTLVWGAGE